MNSSDCYEGAVNVIYNGWYLSMQLMQIAFDILTIFVVIRKRSYISKRLVNKDAVFLISVVLLAFCLHALVFSATQVHHIIYDYYFIQPNCELLISNFTCMFVKIGTQCYTIFLSLMFIVQCCERTVATFFIDRAEYQTATHLFWKLSSLVTFLIATFLATLVYYKDPEDPVNLASCWFHTSVSKTRVDTKYYGLMITDTIALIWMSLLYFINKRMSNKLVISLNKKYQMRENIEITQIILICGCIYSILIIVHAGSNMIRRSIGLAIVIYRVMGMLLYCMSYANLSYVSCLYFLLKRKENTKIENIQQDVSKARHHASHSYFAQYRW